MQLLLLILLLLCKYLLWTRWTDCIAIYSTR